MRYSDLKYNSRARAAFTCDGIKRYGEFLACWLRYFAAIAYALAILNIDFALSRFVLILSHSHSIVPGGLEVIS